MFLLREGSTCEETHAGDFHVLRFTVGWPGSLVESLRGTRRPAGEITRQGMEEHLLRLMMNPRSLVKSRSHPVWPVNEHEVVITRIVDRIADEGRLDASVIDEIFDAIDFAMTHSHGEFLVDYIRWRRQNPIVNR